MCLCCSGVRGVCTNECVLLTCVAYANVIDQGMCLSLVLCGYGCLRVCSLIRLLRAYVLWLCAVMYIGLSSAVSYVLLCAMWCALRVVCCIVACVVWCVAI